MGAYLVPQVGDPIYFDVVITETVTRDADTTQFPVEQGANITDHYQVKVNAVKLEVFVSQEPIDPSIHPEGSGSYGELTITWQPYPSPPILATVVTAIANPVGSILRNLNQDTTSATLQGALQWGAPFDPLATLLARLDDLRSKATLIDVATASAYYANMLLGKIETERDKATGSGTRVSIELGEINQVATEQVAAPAVAKKKDAPPQNKGAQQPKDPGEMTSAAKGILNLLTGS